MTKKKFMTSIQLDVKNKLLRIYVIRKGDPWKTAKYIYGRVLDTTDNQIQQMKEEMYKELLKHYPNKAKIILFTGPTAKEVAK